jgi:Leucine Rich Repeat (LRR) protein
MSKGTEDKIVYRMHMVKPQQKGPIAKRTFYRSKPDSLIERSVALLNPIEPPIRKFSRNYLVNRFMILHKMISDLETHLHEQQKPYLPFLYLSWFEQYGVAGRVRITETSIHEINILKERLTLLKSELNYLKSALPKEVKDEAIPLPKSTWISEADISLSDSFLDLQNRGIHNDGAQAIADTLKKNQTLRKLNISSNPIDDRGLLPILEVLITHKGLVNRKPKTPFHP